MIDFTNVWTITRKELRDALRNRWFILFTIAFAGLSLAFSLLAQPSGSKLQLSGYSRTAASLINLVLLFIPLIGLTLGASNLVGERERGVLSYLLAQPVTRLEVLLGKYLGLAGALFASLSLGFGVAGAALGLRGQVSDAAGYLLTVALACLLALTMLSLGFALSTVSHKTSTALGGALFLWLLLVFIGDLGVMGSAVVTQMPISTVFFLAVLNPLQMFKLSSILTIQANLEVLGPAGLYATHQFGDSLLPLLILGLLAWIVIPLLAAVFLFSRDGQTAFRKSVSA